MIDRKSSYEYILFKNKSTSSYIGKCAFLFIFDFEQIPQM